MRGAGTGGEKEAGQDWGSWSLLSLLPYQGAHGDIEGQSVGGKSTVEKSREIPGSPRGGQASPEVDNGALTTWSGFL
jgi:hypothetical protein